LVACRRNRSNYAAHTAQTGQQKEMTTTCMRKHSRLLDDLLCLRSVPTCSSACKYTQKMGEHSLEWVGAKQAFCYCQCKCTVSANVEHMLTYCAGNRRHQRQSESAVCLHHPDPGLCHHPAPLPSLLLTLPVAARHWVGRCYSVKDPRACYLRCSQLHESGSMTVMIVIWVVQS